MPYSVLVIDDVKRILDIVRLFLEQEGYIVKTAQDPYEGIKIAQEGGIDLVILDIMMPGLDGYKVYEIMKSDERTRDIPIIMLTAKAVIMNTPKEFFYGLYGFLSKPFTKGDLLKIVEDVLRLTKADEETRFLKIVGEEEPNP